MPPVSLKPYPENDREPTLDDLSELVARAEQFPGTPLLVAEMRQ
ncbi:hypothetical protein P6B95_11840 [Streptomyces atratus]|nr:hypothetical protein [Streptomyces atratus]WPW27993.1 hypothetical protein P6B95_11840 [Streptomyces atratus]